MNRAALLALIARPRIFIELRDVVVGLVLNGTPDPKTVPLVILVLPELYMRLRLIGQLRRT